MADEVQKVSFSDDFTKAERMMDAALGHACTLLQSYEPPSGTRAKAAEDVAKRFYALIKSAQ